MKKKGLIAAAVVLTAFILAFALAACGSKTFTVRLESGSDVTLHEVESGGQFDEPTVPERDGYDFTGWYIGEEKQTFPITVTSNVTLTAGWEQSRTRFEVTVKIILENAQKNEVLGFSAPVTALEVLSSAELSELTDGYWLKNLTFDGGEAVSGDTVLSGDTALTAEYKLPYTFRVYSEAGYFGAVENVMGDTASELEAAFTALNPYESEIGGEKKTIGSVSGWYSDDSYSYDKRLNADSTLADNARVYLKSSFILKPYLLGADYMFAFGNGELQAYPSVIEKDSKTENVAYLSQVTGSESYGAAVEIDKGEITSVKHGGKTYSADADNLYYLEYNGKVINSVSPSDYLEGTVSADGSGRFTYRSPTVRVRSFNIPSVLKNLKTGLNDYLGSDAFAQTLNSSVTMQSRVPLMYLKYMEKNYYSEAQTTVFGQIMDAVSTAIDPESGLISNELFSSSKVNQSLDGTEGRGWYSYADYFYTFSLVYNQYSEYLLKTGKTENPYSRYLPAVKEYLMRLSDAVYNEDMEITSGGAAIKVSAYSLINRTADVLKNASALIGSGEMTVSQLVAVLTENLYMLRQKALWPDLQSRLAWVYDELPKLRLSLSYADKLRSVLLEAQPKIGVAFGYSLDSVIAAAYANLGFEKDKFYMYAEDNLARVYTPQADGSYPASTDCNWVGFSGAPLARSVLRNRADYFADYEKCMQAYYPYEDKGMNGQGIDAMVNLDRLYADYNMELDSSSGVEPRYALLTMYAHGMQPMSYTKAIENGEAGTKYNIISLWLNTLNTDENGAYIIDDVLDMAVATCFIVKTENPNAAPSPLGVVSAADFVIGA